MGVEVCGIRSAVYIFRVRDFLHFTAKVLGDCRSLVALAEVSIDIVSRVQTMSFYIYEVDETFNIHKFSDKRITFVYLMHTLYIQA